jgi:hypothetical protein
MNTTSNKNSKVPSTATNTLFLLAAFGMGMLLALIVGMLGAWPIIMTLLAGVSILALMIFTMKSVIESNCYSNAYNPQPFTYMPVYKVMYSLRRIPSHQQGRREGQEEFVPFVFNDKK